MSLEKQRIGLPSSSIPPQPCNVHCLMESPLSSRSGGEIALLCSLYWRQSRYVQSWGKAQMFLRTVIWKPSRVGNQDLWFLTSFSSCGNSPWVQLLCAPEPDEYSVVHQAWGIGCRNSSDMGKLHGFLTLFWTLSFWTVGLLKRPLWSYFVT